MGYDGDTEGLLIRIVSLTYLSTEESSASHGVF